MKLQIASEVTPEDQIGVKNFLDEVVRRTGVNGISVAVQVRETSLRAKAGLLGQFYQDCDRELRHPLAPTHEGLVALVINELITRNILQAHVPIAAYLPELAGRFGDVVTVTNLLAHSTGFSAALSGATAYSGRYELTDFADASIKLDQWFQPGRVYDRNPLNTAILAHLAEVACHGALEAQIERLVFGEVGARVLWGHLVEDLERARNVQSKGVGLVRANELKFPPPGSRFLSRPRFSPWIKMSELARLGSGLSIAKPALRSQSISRLGAELVAVPTQFIGRLAGDAYYIYGHGCARYPTGMYGFTSLSQGSCVALRFSIEQPVAVAVAIQGENVRLRDVVSRKVVNALFPQDLPEHPKLIARPKVVRNLANLEGVYVRCENDRYRATYEDNCLMFRRTPDSGTESGGDPIAFMLNCDALGHVVPTSANANLAIGVADCDSRDRFYVYVDHKVYVHEGVTARVLQ
jgi:CubicO group peptidase (beta-lactamase class C family)